MLKWQSRWRNSIFFRLMFFFFVIMLSIFIMGVNIYDWGMRIINGEISSAMNSQILFYLNNLEIEIQRIKVLQSDCLNDENLNQLAVLPQSLDDYSRTKALLALQARLDALRSSSAYIKDVRAHISRLGKTVSALNGVIDIPQQDFKMMGKSAKFVNSQIFIEEGRLFLCEIYPLREFSEYLTPLYIIDIELSGGKIKNALAQFDNAAGSGVLLTSLSFDYTIASGAELEGNPAVQSLIENSSKNISSSIDSLTINGNACRVIYAKSDYLNMVLSRYIPEKQMYKPLKKYGILFWGFSILPVIIIFVFSFSTYRFIHKPLLTLVRSFKHVENGKLDIAIKHNHKDEFDYLYRCFNEMVKNLNNLIHQVYEQKILAQKAELKQLQMQISPHFLYNSFFVLYRMIKGEEQNNALHFAKQLGNYFQYITRSAADEVPLVRELEHARIYAEIQAKRFRNRIKLKFNSVPEEYNNILVPRLILQPVIENAFEHGLVNKTDQGILQISFDIVEGFINISVEDNGEELSDPDIYNMQEALSSSDSNMESTGMINIHRRLRINFGEGSGIDIYRSSLGGLKVVIKMKLKDGADKCTGC